MYRCPGSHFVSASMCWYFWVQATFSPINHADNKIFMGSHLFWSVKAVLPILLYEVKLCPQVMELEMECTCPISYLSCSSAWMLLIEVLHSEENGWQCADDALNAFCWQKTVLLLVKFHWNLFLIVKSTISQDWFWKCLVTEEVPSHYLKQCRLMLMQFTDTYASLCINLLISKFWWNRDATPFCTRNISLIYQHISMA